MKNAWTIAAVAGALAAPSIATARQVAIYVTDRNGSYHSTLWVAGTKKKYWRHLGDWNRATGGNAKVDGITGASVGAGKTLRVDVELADALLDAGYVIHVDTAVEKMKENPSEVVVPLTRAGTGKPAAGRGYVKSFRYTL